MRAAITLTLLLAGCGPTPQAAPPVPVPVPAPAPETAPVEERRRLTPSQAERAEEIVRKLASADKGERAALLQAMRSEVGGAGLAMALDTVAAEPEQTRWFQTHQLMEMISDLADPDAVDALAKWAAKPSRHPHFRGVAGEALAEVGDLRAVPLLSARMKLAPADVYDRAKFWQADAGGHLTRTDRPRVVAARLLSDLAVIHLKKRDEIRAQAEDAVLAWVREGPQPHSNGLRFLAAVGSEKAVAPLRAWAFPPDPLPAVGALPPFPRAYETAQSALRYIGWLRDPASLDPMIAQLSRKAAGENISQDALMSMGIAMRAMALRAVGYGAANGLSHWGPRAGAKARDALVKLIEDPTWHEEARYAACLALGSVASPAWRKSLTAKVKRFATDKDPKVQHIGECYAETLSRTATELHVLEMATLMLDSNVSPSVRLLLAVGIGRAGVSPKARALLSDAQATNALADAAKLALLLGGSEEDVRSALKAGESSELRDLYFRHLGYFSVDDLKTGALERWTRNARAGRDGGHAWMLERLGSQLDNAIFDNGPHSITATVLRMGLLRRAREGTAEQRQAAVHTLAAASQRGVLMALARDDGSQAEVAKRMLAELEAQPD